mmetsp:Transcript_56877/g.124418  ORF Transcript_56877/g.124418 Transcript_56877/m.124418 type:complete len:88 (+) Transcript_56877:136-399(+)
MTTGTAIGEMMTTVTADGGTMVTIAIGTDDVGRMIAIVEDATTEMTIAEVVEETTVMMMMMTMTVRHDVAATARRRQFPHLHLQHPQ